MTSLLRTLPLVLALVLAPGFMACNGNGNGNGDSNGDESSGESSDESEDEGSDGDEQAAADLFEEATLDLKGLVAKGPVPKGWQKNEQMGYYVHGGGLYQDRYWPSGTCEGNCATIAANIETFAARQVEMHQSTYDATVVRDAPVEGREGVRVVELELKKKRGGDIHRQWVVFYYQDGWERALKVDVYGVTEDVLGRWDEFKDAALSMEVTPK